jgi:hypothetical protein
VAPLLVALRFRCSALAKVSFSSLVSARVKWLPPSGMGRCQITLPPSVTTRLLESVPRSSAATAGPLPSVGVFGSLLSRSKEMKLARAKGAIWMTWTSTLTSLKCWM